MHDSNRASNAILVSLDCAICYYWLIIQKYWHMGYKEPNHGHLNEALLVAPPLLLAREHIVWYNI